MWRLLAILPAALLAGGQPSAAEPRAAGDLPPCPGINPDIRRPPGSNCLGIHPSQCGADVLRQFLGRRYDEALRRRILQLIGDRQLRAFQEGEPVTDDLRPDRINLVYDTRRRIIEIDCY